MSDLVTITVDGVEVSVPNGTLVVDAAKRIGNDIPVFCYHPKMSPVGMCRMCLVEIGMPMRDRATGEMITNEDGTPKINFGPALQTACTVRVSPGMVVRTSTNVVTEAREAIVEFILSSHPLDCPICDKGGECPLQNLTIAHGKDDSRMVFTDKMKLDKHVPLGELIFLDRERCIQCARCVRFQEEVVDDQVLQFHNRGRSLEIVTMSDPGFDSYWSGNTTDICPVGALTTADFRFGARPWEMIPVASLSPHSPAGSNVTFSTRIEAAAGGRTVIKRVMPRQHELVNETWISDRDRFVHHFADAPERLKKPLLRMDGKLVEVSWTEALDFVAGKLQGFAGTAVAGLSGDRVSNEDLFMFQKFIRKGLQSNNVDLANPRLGGGEVVAQVGVVNDTTYDFPQRLGAGDAVLVVASDLHEEEPIWWLRARQAAVRGATLVVLNVRPTRLDRDATFVIHYAPGTAVETVRQLLNSAKVEVEASDNQLIAAAQALVKANNLTIFYGAEGVTYAETEAIARLLGNLLLVKDGGEGHVGRVNNGLIPVWPHNNTQGAWDMGVHPALEPGYKLAKEAGLNAPAIYKGVANGDIQALYLMGADPIGDGLLADRGQLALLVVQELFLTETAVVADVVLPAQSWAEREGTFTSGERRVQRYFPAITPVGESRPDWQILAQVGERLGLGKPPFAASLVFRDLAKAVKPYKGMDYRSLSRVEKQWPDVGGEDLYYGGNAYENRSGLGQQWEITPPAEPFAVPDVAVDTPEEMVLVRAAALYTPGTLNRYSKVLAPRLAQPTLLVHPADAASLNLVDGELAAVSLNSGQVEATVRVNEDAPEGVALIRGVPYQPGTAVARITKLAEKVH